MRIHVFEHDPAEGIGSIAQWADKNGHTVASTRWYAGERAPHFDQWDLLIVMGGPMGIYDHAEHPWLVAEKAALQQAMDGNSWCLGICLGAQLLADRLGGAVVRNAHQEIGWFPVSLLPEGQTDELFGVLPAVLDVFHWHGDTFALPPGALHAASTPVCAHQAFRRNRVVGLQFHLEFTVEALAGLVASTDNFDGPYVQTPVQFLAQSQKFERLEAHAHVFLDNLAKAIAPR